MLALVLSRVQSLPSQLTGSSWRHVHSSTWPLMVSEPALSQAPRHTSSTPSIECLLQAYFRDVTKEDLCVLLPAFDSPLQDPAYTVPAIGPHFSADDLILSPRATRGLKAIGAAAASRSIPVSLEVLQQHS